VAFSPTSLPSSNRAAAAAAAAAAATSIATISTRVPNPVFQVHTNGYDIETFSHDPKCYLIHNFLSAEECQAYISKLSEVNPERIKQSNAPKVSLQIEKLWPLPFLCLGTGIPPLIRLLDKEGTSNFLQFWNHALPVVVPPILLSFGIVAILMIVVTSSLQKLANQSARTSASVALNTEQDCDFIRPLIERASTVTHHPWMNWEAPVLTKYSPGALFASHNDASPTRGSEWADLGGQRIVTVITYLNTCHRGGATKFDLLDFQVQPKEGSALVFFPADEISLKADGRTVHQSVSKRVIECCVIECLSD
jgi:hypothetical protein